MGELKRGRMNTPAHLIMGVAAFGKPGRRRITAGALFGALAPDVSLYVMVSWSIWVLGIEPRVVFGQYYYSGAWQQVFAVDNSFILWGLAWGSALVAQACDDRVFRRGPAASGV
jgi:hypothetical protein